MDTYKMSKQGDRVRTMPNGDEGVVTAIDQNDRFALVSFKNEQKWLPMEDLENISLIDQFLKHDLSDSQIFILSMVSYNLINEYAYNPYVLASSSKIEIFPHQIDEVTKILENTRVMLADEVGLGKTIVAGLIACELNARGLADRILFVVPKSLVKKWMNELQDRFDITTIELSSDYVREMKNAMKSPFAFEYTVASIDYLRQFHIMEDIERYSARWDLVIFDEAHKLVKNDQMETRRYSLAKLLSSTSKFVLLLTATRHSGDIPAFYNRLKLLDSSVVEEVELQEIPDYTHLLIRNIKEDVITLDGKDNR